MNQSQDVGPVTERSEARDREEHDFTPVIVKRIDLSRRHPDDILEHAIQSGVQQLRRSTLSLALSAVAAGLMLTFSAMAIAVMDGAVDSALGPFGHRLAAAFVYPLGFVLCIMAGMELFTEHTATAVYPVLDGREGGGHLLRLWGLVLGGNLVGAAIGSTLLLLADGVIQRGPSYVTIGETMAAYGSGPLFVSAVLAGCLMALGAWLIHATPPEASQIFVIYIVTFLIGVGGLHHSIAGAVEVFAALWFGASLGAVDALRVIALSVLGNLVGGSVLVALLNYGHIRRSQVIKHRPRAEDAGPRTERPHREQPAS